MTEPNESLLDGVTPTVEFAGKKWPVPKLAIKQLKVIQPKLDRLADVVITKETPMREYTEEDFGDLATVLYFGLTRAHPTLTRDEFEDMPTNRYEIAAAFFVVFKQSTRERPATAEASGEAQGAASP